MTIISFQLFLQGRAGKEKTFKIMFCLQPNSWFRCKTEKELHFVVKICISPCFKIYHIEINFKKYGQIYRERGDILVAEDFGNGDKNSD